MIVSDLIKNLESKDPNAEVIAVVYTDDGYEAGYIDRIDDNVRYNSVSKERIKDDESFIEITTTTQRRN